MMHPVRSRRPGAATRCCAALAALSVAAIGATIGHAAVDAGAAPAGSGAAPIATIDSSVV